MNATLIAAGIGAAAGLVTGLGSALVAVRGARMQAGTAMAAQRRQWQVENLRASYSAVMTSFRQLMMAWWALRARGATDRETGVRLHDQVVASYPVFTSACAAVTLLAPPQVAVCVDALATATVEFDRLADGMDFLNRKRWSETDQEAYEKARQAAEDQHDVFVQAAREQLQRAADRRIGRCRSDVGA